MQGGRGCGGLSRVGSGPSHSSHGRRVVNVGHDARQPGFKSHLLHLLVA